MVFGDAGDDQSQGGEGNSADGDEHKKREQIAKVCHMENHASEEQFD